MVQCPRPFQQMMRRHAIRDFLVVLLLNVLGVSLGAESTANTNKIALTYLPPPVTLESTVRSEVFTRRLFEEIMDSSSIVFDRFTGPASRLGWARKEDRLGYGSIEEYNMDGARLFSTIGLDSLRTAATEALPPAQWPDQWEARFGDLLTGTLGNPQEEHFPLTSGNYSAVRSSWERDSEKAGVQWGLRPWRTSPYFYFLAQAGRLEGQRLVIFETRARYTLLGASRIEARLSLQLPGAFRLAGSGSVDPARFGTSDPSATQIGFTLERVVPSRTSGVPAVFYVGFRSGVTDQSSNPRTEHLVVMGLAKAW